MQEKKKLAKKGILIGVMLLFALLLFAPSATGVVQAKGSSFQSMLTNLQKKYPDGKFWNHKPGTRGNGETVTNKPCNHSTHAGHSYDGLCGCNSFMGREIQCMGFASQLGYEIFGTVPRDRWKKLTDKSALKSVKPGDIIRYANHSIFVLEVDGDTLKIADCNSAWNCNIRWNAYKTKTEIISKGFAYIYHADTYESVFTPCAPIGTEFVISGYKYEVNGEYTASFAGLISGKTNVTVPDTVTFRNVKYKITRILNRALYKNKKIKKLTIGKNIQKIGKEAFKGCSKLSTVKIKSEKLKKSVVGTNAFAGLYKSVKVYAPEKKLMSYLSILRARGAKKQLIAKAL